jgi:hypothetical protein
LKIVLHYIRDYTVDHEKPKGTFCFFVINSISNIILIRYKLIFLQEEKEEILRKREDWYSKKRAERHEGARRLLTFMKKARDEKLEKKRNGTYYKELKRKNWERRQRRRAAAKIHKNKAKHWFDIKKYQYVFTLIMINWRLLSTL